MRFAIWVSVLLFVAVKMAGANDSLPVLEPGSILNVGDAPLSIGHTASVEVVDWNNDGKKDLLVGTFAGGNIQLFLNTGTDAAPVFAGGERLNAGDEILSVGAG